MSRAQTLWICGGSLLLLGLLGGRALVQVAHGVERAWFADRSTAELEPPLAAAGPAGATG